MNDFEQYLEDSVSGRYVNPYLPTIKKFYSKALDNLSQLQSSMMYDSVSETDWIPDLVLTMAAIKGEFVEIGICEELVKKYGL